ncbi:hypothetical protein LINPERHAP1_LOCUS11638, partial [Linum perenne]
FVNLLSSFSSHSSQAITDTVLLFFFDFTIGVDNSPTHPSSTSSFSSSLISRRRLLRPIPHLPFSPSFTSSQGRRSLHHRKEAAAHMANNTAAAVSTDLSAKRLRDQDQHGTSAPAPAGEAIETETAAVAADKGTSNLSVVIPGWFFENSPMWPGTFFENSPIRRRPRFPPISLFSAK